MVKKKYQPRQLMELAVEVMRKSVTERRTDGKAGPLVGAVLLKPNGVVETAHRGELRDGDHAEYTLLERKNRDVRLDGSILFATLEPCAPGARKNPKLGCAERIVLARIKEVYVGIEDPDPTVDRKGIKYLQDNGVTVHMFDRDLQDVIYQANQEFIEQAAERAAEAAKKPRKVTLSYLEDAYASSAPKDLSNEALEAYRSAARIGDKLGTAEFNQRLLRIGVLKETPNGLKPTGFGFLLFGAEPRTAFPQAGLLATIHYADGSEETRDFEAPLALIPNQVEQWLRDKLPNVIDRGRMQRRRVEPVPFEMIREAVVNALVHRDYDIREGKCQLTVTPDKITVKSPGGPLAPITLEQLQAFSAPMLSRNPELHYVFARMDMAEERGLGLRSLMRRADQLKLPRPQYRWDEPYLTLDIFRHADAVLSEISIPKVLLSSDETEKKGWQWLVAQSATGSHEYAQALGVPTRTAQRHLNKFARLGLVRKSGSARATRYTPLRKDKR